MTIFDFLRVIFANMYKLVFGFTLKVIGFGILPLNFYIMTMTGRGGRIGRAPLSRVGDRRFEYMDKRVKAMTYKIDTCRILSRFSACVG